MGRRGSMKGRPGLLFVVFIFVCVILFYLSWQMLMAPRFETVKKPKSSYAVREGIKLSRLQDFGHRSSGNQYENPWIRKSTFENLNTNQGQMPKPFINDSEKRSQPGKENGQLTGPEEVKSGLHPSIPSRDDSGTQKSDYSKETRVIKQEKGLSQPLRSENGFYQDPIASIKDYVRSMDRLVHLDFKGAVPKMSYLREVIPLFKSLGATGLLVEYEDMFPFSGTLKDLRAADAFTPEQLNEFLQLAKNNSLMVMPLVQTFGHMEFALKSAFPWLRESSYTPQVLDMTNNSSYSIISEMVQQVLDAHPYSAYLHIGCDEVYELGRGASASVMHQKRMTQEQMFLQHVKRVASIVSSYQARKVTPIMWDDMLRKTSVQDILRSSLPSLVEVMVWHYTPNVTGLIGADVFAKYEQLFTSIWIASSFKGATGSRQFYTEPLYHIQNHFSWLTVIEQHHQNIKFKGVALTGWQRYDHFATLCELLPVAVPSLAVCLATLKNAGFTEVIHESTSKILRCDNKIQMTFPEIDKKTNRAIITQDCRFPGSDVYYAMQDFYAATQIKVQHRLDGWFSDYQVSHGYTNPGQIKVLAMMVNRQNNGFVTSEGPLKMHLSSIYSPHVVDEWLEENIYERERRNKGILEKVNTLLKFKVWPRRPLPAVLAENVKRDESQQEIVNKDSPSVAVRSEERETQGRVNQGIVSKDQPRTLGRSGERETQEGRNQGIVSKDQSRTMVMSEERETRGQNGPKVVAGDGTTNLGQNAGAQDSNGFGSSLHGKVRGANEKHSQGSAPFKDGEGSEKQSLDARSDQRGQSRGVESVTERQQDVYQLGEVKPATDGSEEKLSSPDTFDQNERDGIQNDRDVKKQGLPHGWARSVGDRSQRRPGIGETHLGVNVAHPNSAPKLTNPNPGEIKPEADQQDREERDNGLDSDVDMNKGLSKQNQVMAIQSKGGETDLTVQEKFAKRVSKINDKDTEIDVQNTKDDGQITKDEDENTVIGVRDTEVKDQNPETGVQGTKVRSQNFETDVRGMKAEGQNTKGIVDEKPSKLSYDWSKKEEERDEEERNVSKTLRKSYVNKPESSQNNDFRIEDDAQKMGAYGNQAGPSHSHGQQSDFHDAKMEKFEKTLIDTR